MIFPPPDQSKLDGLRFERLLGEQAESRIDQLAQLRMNVFRSWPYLYEGSIDYERNYLRTYVQSLRSFILLVLDGDNAVGATSAVPLADEDEAFQLPFLSAGYDTASIFYYGESILLPEYRGLGIYRRFFADREAHARSFGTYRLVCFCSVIRPDDHPQRPPDERTLEAVWRHFGFEPSNKLIASFSWRDIGCGEKTEKPMQFWLKPLS